MKPKVVISRIHNPYFLTSEQPLKPPQHGQCTIPQSIYNMIRITAPPTRNCDVNRERPLRSTKKYTQKIESLVSPRVTIISSTNFHALLNCYFSSLRAILCHRLTYSFMLSYVFLRKVPICNVISTPCMERSFNVKFVSCTIRQDIRQEL